MNCVRWVTSCSVTHMRKSDGSTSSRRSVSTMFGATRMSRPDSPSGRNASYWPSTLLDSQASIVPICTPATFAVAAAASALGCLSSSRFVSGSSTTRKPSTLACDQPGRSTTVASSTSPGGVRPVTARTCSSAVTARRRSSATASPASAHDTAGGAGARRRAVATARS